MGRQKDAELAKEDAWDRKAQAEGIRCSLCGELIIHCEREVYFRTGMCGYHAHMMAKDD
ncbi:hypothetical protein [Shewanella algae]|uniref:hypothetical protein n=1 Tax=Shewanella algae TaxID=38313 RepID=UPI0013DE4103|nr:hypothetical protein [Shewanella algae]